MFPACPGTYSVLPAGSVVLDTLHLIKCLMPQWKRDMSYLRLQIVLQPWNCNSFMFRRVEESVSTSPAHSRWVTRHLLTLVAIWSVFLLVRFIKAEIISCLQTRLIWICCCSLMMLSSKQKRLDFLDLRSEPPAPPVFTGNSPQQEAWMDAETFAAWFLSHNRCGEAGQQTFLRRFSGPIWWENTKNRSNPNVEPSSAGMDNL